MPSQRAVTTATGLLRLGRAGSGEAPPDHALEEIVDTVFLRLVR
ncbi:hypothetical protein ACF082_33050 [Streptomyces lydicus]